MTYWRPLKRFCTGSGEYGLNITAESYKDESDGIRLLRTTDIGEDSQLRNDVQPVFVSSEAASEMLLTPGDILFSRSGTVGRAYMHSDIAEPMTFAGYLVRFRPHPTTDPRYLKYCSHASFFTDQIASDAVVSTIANFNAERYGALHVPWYARHEQRLIADFLDAETGQIDDLLAKKRRMVTLLEERIESLIRKRIAESALVSDAGTESTTSINKVLTKLERPSTPDGEMITAFRDGQVTARAFRRADGYTLSWTQNSQLQGVRRDDVVVHGLDGFAGAVGVSEADGVCSPVYHVCAPRAEGDPVYLGRMLRILAVSGYLGLFASSTRERAVDFRNWDLFGRIPVPDVDPSEQREVGNSIRKIAPLKRAVERSAELANEYRQALITAAVTGEMEIPGVRR